MSWKKSLFLTTIMLIPLLSLAQVKQISGNSINVTEASAIDEFGQDSLDREEALKREQEQAQQLQPPKIVAPVIKQQAKAAEIPKSTNKSRKSFPPRLIDLQIPSFEKSRAGQQYLKNNGGSLPDKTDVWGYPEIKIPDWDKRPENNKSIIKDGSDLKKGTFIRFLDKYFLSKAHANDSIGVANGFVNCRDNATITGGYFRAYFRDIALNNNAGYSHQSWGPERVEAVCDVLQEIATLINLDQTNTIPEIIFEAGLPAGTPSNALAAASSFFGYSTTNIDNGTLHKHIISGVDPNPGYFDAVVYTNWAQSSFVWDIDISTPSSLPIYDFRSVMRHEVIHALGFLNRLPEIVSTSGAQVTHGLFNQSMFEKQVAGNPQNPFFNLTQPLAPILLVPNAVQPAWFKSNQTVYSGKKNFIGAISDGVRHVFSPFNWTSGSSLSHFDDLRANSVVVTNTNNICGDYYPLNFSYTMNPFACPSTPTQIHLHEKEALCHLGYQVDGVSQCNVPTPAAMDDKIILTSVTSATFTQCVPMINNDISRTGNNSGLVVHDAFTEAMPAGFVVEYFSDTNCSSSNLLSSANSARSVKISGANGSSLAGAMKIRYRIRNTNTSPSRISDPASIIITSCTFDPEEYVCNGSFELGAINESGLSSYWNSAFFQGRIPFWTSEYTCDLVFKNRPGFVYDSNNLPYIFAPTYPINQQIRHDMSDTGSYAGFCRTNLSPTASPNTRERLFTKLKTNLISGQTYKISFDVHMEYSQLAELTSPILANLNVIAGLSPTCIFTATGNQTPFCANQGGTYLNAVSVVNQSIPVRNAISVSGSNIKQSVWTHVSQTFTATQNHNYLLLRTADAPYHIYTYYDNVSIKKVTPPKSTISGVVYRDILNTNGTRDQGEQGVESVNVKLFSTNSTLVAQATTSNDPINPGTFTLELPNSNNATYYAVLAPESNYYDITEPVQNNSTLLNGYQHVKVINFTGTNLENKNFGVIISPPPMVLTSSTQVGCKPNKGSIDLTVAGGVQPYTYIWNNGASTQDINNLSPGVYSVTVQDNTGQSAALNNIIITPYVPIMISGLVVPNATGTNAMIDVSASGAAPLSYSWNTGAITQDLYNVPQGTYTVTVTDANKCTKSASFEYSFNGSCCKVRPNANPLINCSDPIMNLGNSTVELGRNRCVGANGGNSCYWDFSNPSCCYPGAQGCGQTSGTACTPPMQSIPYPFSSLNVSTPGYPELLKQCMGEAQSVILTSAEAGTTPSYFCCVALPLNLSAVARPSCTGKTGSIDLSISGGTTPYTISWSNGASTEDISNLVPGTYTVNVTAANGMTASLSVNLASVGPVSISGLVSPATAPSFNNGSINITVNPSVGYSYSWVKSGGGWSSAVEDPQNLTPGSYTVTAINKFLCKASKNFNVQRSLKPASDVIKKP